MFDIQDKKVTDLLRIHITSSSGPRKNIRQSRALELRKSTIEITSKVSDNTYTKEIPFGNYSRKTMAKLVADFVQEIFSKEKARRKRKIAK